MNWINRVRLKIEKCGFNGSARTKVAQLNIGATLLLRIVGMSFSYISIPLTIDYLSSNVYGTWLTVSSVVLMLTSFDIGIGNGLRNKLSEAVAVKDNLLAKKYISSAYGLFGIFQMVLTLLFFIIYRYIPWQKVFNSTIDRVQLQDVIIILFISMSMKLLLDIITYILMALQKAALAYSLGFVSNLLILLGTLLLVNYTEGDIVILSLLTGGTPILVLFTASLILYRKKLSHVKPSFKYIKKGYAKDILSLGYKFFVIQIASIILYYCDNIIIAQLFNPLEVTVYNISYKYFNSIMIFLTIILTPFWSAITEAAALNDYKWMKSTYKQLTHVWIGIILLSVLMVLLSDTVYEIWIGRKIRIPYVLTCSMAIYQIVMSWNRIVTVIANGVGKVKLQLYYTIASAVINIPLALFLSKNIIHSAAGVTLATTISSLLCTYIGTIQTHRILNKRAYGIWNK